MRLAIVLCLCAGLASAADYSDGISGDEAVALVVEAMEAAGVEAPTPAAPIRGFPACSVAPKIGPLNGSWSTAEFFCPDGRGWTRAFRTKVAPTRPSTSRIPEPRTVALTDMVIGLKRSMSDGEMVTMGDLMLVPRGTARPADVFTSPDQVVGRRLKTTIGTEQILLTRHLEPAWMVRAGTPVVLEIATGSFVVTAPGESLEDGRYGDVIALRNLSSQKIVKGFVAGHNRVALRPNM